MSEGLKEVLCLDLRGQAVPLKIKAQRCFKIYIVLFQQMYTCTFVGIRLYTLKMYGENNIMLQNVSNSDPAMCYFCVSG
jgi:hypothetical protein